MPVLTSTVLFACADETALHDIEKLGLNSSENGGIPLFESLSDAERLCGGAILVVDRASLRLPAGLEGRDLIITSLPAESIQNTAPYAAPLSISAAGGFVTRRTGDRVELLLIFRRGEWDLPKGKVDEGETIEAAAVREVREELGIDGVQLGQPLGRTVHGYRHRGRYMVKTTHWFEMHVSGEEFRPQEEEGIHAVAWVPLDEAPDRLGYESLQLHTARVAHRIS